MDRINLPFYYELGSILGAVANASPDAVTDAAADGQLWAAAWRARNQVNLLFQPPWNLKVAWGAATAFSTALESFGSGLYPKQGEQPANDALRQTLRRTLVLKASEFQTVLQAELQIMAAYFVPQQGIYQTDDLIDRAEITLPEEVRTKLSEMALNEVRESGRCLAFGLPTACGFHMMRAVEDVVRDYCQTIPEMKGAKGQTIHLPKNRKPTWGDFTAYLEHCHEPDVEETRALLLAVKRNERDVIAHPERVLSMNEAYTLFQKGQAAITSMAERIPSTWDTRTVPFNPEELAVAE